MAGRDRLTEKMTEEYDSAARQLDTARTAKALTDTEAAAEHAVNAIHEAVRIRRILAREEA